MGNLILKRVGLTAVCVAILVTAFAINPVGAQPQRGPRVDRVRWKVTRGPAAQLIEMTLGPPDGSDIWTSSIRQPWASAEMYQTLVNGGMRPGDLVAMAAQGMTMSSRSAFHICGFSFNYRNPPLDDVNFRHALAHLVPKDRLVGTLFGFISIPISSPVPPTQGLWYNPYVDPHPYGPGEAKSILKKAGYQMIGGVWYMPDGSPVPSLRLYCPLAIVSPTSNTICTMFVAQAARIGLSITLEPMDFSTYTRLAFDEWDFDIFWVCWSLTRFPTHLYSFFHSSQNFQGSYNPYGIDYPELDEQIEIFYHGLDHPAKVAAAMKAQELLMGGTITDPLAKPAQPERSQAIPLIPVYSRHAYDAQQPDLRGAVNMFGYGINNMWTWMNIYWNTPNEYRPGTRERMVVPILDEFPETLNPTSADTVYAWTFMDPVFDGLMATNPWTRRDLPWLSTSWSYQPEPGGMYVTFDLRTIDNHGEPIRWQDGDPIDPSDVMFAWDFLADNEIADFWGTMMHYIGSEYVGNEITAHMDTTSQWYVYSLAGSALMFPPQVWSPWDGQPTADIEAWDPSAEAGPGGLPTKVYGTGPFILQHSTRHVTDAGYGDLVANREYWLTTDEIIHIKTEMFHGAGDVNYDAEVAIEDLQAVDLAYDTHPGDAGWNPDADISGPAGVPDEHIGIDDLATTTRFYGETKHVPGG